MTQQPSSQSDRRCDTFDCDEQATHRADWRESGGFYCDECAGRLRLAGDNVHPLERAR